MRQFVPVALQLPYLHFTFIAGALFFISLYFLLKRARATYAQLRRKWNPPAPYDPRLLKYDRNATLFWLIMLIPSGMLLALAFYLSSYQLLAGKAVIAGRAEWNGNIVRFIRYDGNVMTSPVKGSRAAAAGIFLKFPNILRFLGLRTYHRVITFRGSSEFQYHYMPPDPEWLENYVDPFFCSLYAHRKRLKVVDPTYRESPYFGPGKHQIFATHSGYIVN